MKKSKLNRVVVGLGSHIDVGTTTLCGDITDYLIECEVENNFTKYHTRISFDNSNTHIKPEKIHPKHQRKNKFGR